MSKLTDPDWNPAEKPPGGVFQSFGSNLILVGEPGVGKTGIVEGFAQLLVEGKLPDALGRPAVIEISLTSLVAEALLGGKFTDGQTIRLVETDGKIQFLAPSPPQF